MPIRQTSTAPPSRSFRRSVGRFALLAVFGGLLGPVHADPMEASQATVRKSEPVTEVAIDGPTFPVTAPKGGKQGHAPDLTNLHSHSVLILDASSGETLYERNAATVAPIASITKLMTAMVVLDRGQPMNELLTISEEDRDALKLTRSRLRPGATLTREELILLALMASENRAATALGRSYPGGMTAFVDAMNAKAKKLGMADSRFHDPSGLSPLNVSSAPDLARLVKAAHAYPVIREYSTRDRAQVTVLGKLVNFRSTNALIRAGDWDIGLQKTGFINEAGRCLVMRARVASRDLVMVLLDSVGMNARITDAKLVRRWAEANRASAGVRKADPALTRAAG